MNLIDKSVTSFDVPHHRETLSNLLLGLIATLLEVPGFHRDKSFAMTR
jgi:hypothetical protein